MPNRTEIANSMRRRLRSAADRVMMPYVARIRDDLVAAGAGTEPVGSPPGGAAAPRANPSDWFHATLHTLRGIELERLRAARERVLSVGASGSWYFEWFRQAAGDVTEHIGIEAYLPRPDDLPAYATWIANTADHMDDVAAGTIDLVFAGQTSEHLWSHELAGFLLEAHRVLRPGGTLALDSPNRSVTQHLVWSHGEHTIELDAAEISRLLMLAGFRVADVAGLWRCRLDERIWQLEEGVDSPVVATRRVATGRDRPDDCFVWWVNAERTEATPDDTALRAEVDRLFDQHWNARVSRGLFPAFGANLDVPAGASGLLGETLPFPLHPGTWEVTLRLAQGTWDAVDELHLTIVAPGGHVVHAGDLRSATRAGQELRWTFERPDLLFALSLQLVAATRAPISVEFPVKVAPA